MSEFDGGKTQVFIVSKQDGLKWAEVTNLSDLGQGKAVYFIFSLNVWILVKNIDTSLTVVA